MSIQCIHCSYLDYSHGLVVVYQCSYHSWKIIPLEATGASTSHLYYSLFFFYNSAFCLDTYNANTKAVPTTIIKS